MPGINESLETPAASIRDNAFWLSVRDTSEQGTQGNETYERPEIWALELLLPNAQRY